MLISCSQICVDLINELLCLEDHPAMFSRWELETSSSE